MTNLSLLLDAAAQIKKTPTASGYDTEEIAGIALGLAEISTLVNDALEPLKSALRVAAQTELPVPPGTGKIELEGVDHLRDHVGVVSVTFSAQQVKLRKKVNQEENQKDLRKALGSSFDTYFDRRFSCPDVSRK